MDFKKLLRDQKYQNYCCIYRGLAYVGQNLESYTRNGLIRIHQKIYGKLANYGDCTRECSKSFGADTSRWCVTCTSWRKSLLAELRGTKKKYDIKWEDVKSWEWPVSSESIVELFLPWSMPSVNLQDIASQCHVWVSCSEFAIQNHVTKRLKEFRNTYFGHNPSLLATEAEKSKVFDMLRDLIRDPDVKDDLNVTKCLNELQLIEDMDDLTTTASEIHERLAEYHTKIENIARELKKIQRSQEWAQDDFFQTQEEFRHDVQQCHELLIESFDKIQRTKPESNMKVVKLALVVFFSVLIRMIFNSENRGYLKVEEPLPGCISETYSYPFKQDLPLLGYLREHKKLTGRRWLIKELETSLLGPDNVDKGIVLVAEMGFGKSAIISHLLCCKEEEVGYKLRNNIVAFHICKYDVEATQNVGRFVRRRLIAQLASYSEEYGNIISLLPASDIIYDRKACEEEITACFDQGIKFPLNKLSTNNGIPWIILLDGLDECYNTLLKRNLILELLSKRIKHMPYWIKFIITSRNRTALISLKKLKVIYLQSNDPRNERDIHEYMKDALGKHTHLLRNSDLYFRTNFNFLYITQALQYIRAKDNDVVTTLPLTLEDIFEDNFDRYFRAHEDFSVSKVILETICASFRPLDTVALFRIIQTNGLSDTKAFQDAIEKLNFILRFGEYVTLPHQALYYWLIDETNTKYHISVELGHKYISKYMLTMLKQDQNYSENIVNFVIHISESDDVHLSKEFANFSFNHTTGVKMNVSLHRLIWKSSSVKALELLLNHVNDIDELNEGGVSAAFVAAARGNLDQLKLLHKKGASIGFTLSGHFLITSCNLSYKIDFIKQKFYLGYGLIHIAAQHGHENIVTFLIEQNETTIHLKNALGLRPSDVACENGHIGVLLKIMKKAPSVLDNKCLYYASKWNHIAIVQLLMRNGVQLECISEEQAMNSLVEISDISNKTHTLIIDYVFELRNCFREVEVYPYDEWWIIMRENPLFAAIKMSSLEVAKLLIEHFPNKLHCIDSYGYTASLSSVFFGQGDLLPMLSEKLVTDTCTYVTLCHSEVFSSNNESSYATGCPLGASFGHLVAIHRQNKILTLAIDNEFLVDWTATDRYGNHPEHYAASNDNVFYLSFSKEQLKHDILRLRTKNGSTVFHLLSLTSSHFSFKYLTDGFFSNIPDLKDQYEMGILHYVVLRHFNGAENTDKEETLHLITLYMFQQLVEYYNHDIYHVDIFGRNILHYALRFGHYRIVHYLYTKHATRFHHLLSKTDKDGIYPFPFAILQSRIVEMDEKTDFSIGYMFISPSEHIYQVYFKCLNNHECKGLMTSWELSLLYVIQNLNDTEFILYIEPYLSEIIDKSLHLTKAVMIYDKALSDVHFARHILKSLSNKQIARKDILKTIALYRPHAFFMCGTSISPMHHVARRGGIGLLEMLVTQMRISAGYNFNTLNCPDSNGLNILHNALLAGNIQSAKKLLFYDLDVLKDYISLSDIVLMTFTQPVLKVTYLWEKGPEDVEIIDNFLSQVLLRNKNTIEIFQVCCKQCKSLSGIHMATAYSLDITIETMVNLYGEDILNCENEDGFTPFYFAKLFESETFLSLYGELLKFKTPDRDAELHFLISFLIKFPKRGKPDICSCPMSYLPTINRFKYQRLRHELDCVEALTTLSIKGERNCLYYGKFHRTYLLYTVPIISNIIKITHSIQSSYRHQYVFHQEEAVINVFRTLCETLRNLKFSHIFLKEDFLPIEYHRYLPLLTKHLDRTMYTCQRYENGDTCNDGESNISIELIQFLASVENVILLYYRNLRLVMLHCQMQIAQKHITFVGNRNELIFMRNRLPPSNIPEKEFVKALTVNNNRQYMAILRNIPAYKELHQKIEDDIKNELLTGTYSISIGHSIHYKSIELPFHDLETD